LNFIETQKLKFKLIIREKTAGKRAKIRFLLFTYIYIHFLSKQQLKSTKKKFNKQAKRIRKEED
jgi:hypothetical protein